MGLWLVLAVSGAAVCMDFLMEKVVNSFVCLGLAVGLSYQIQVGRLSGVAAYMLGIALPFFLLLPLFAFRMLGAGDIKLFCVLGGILGWSVILKLMVLLFSGSNLICCISYFLWKSKRKRILFFSLCLRICKNRREETLHREGKKS